MENAKENFDYLFDEQETAAKNRPFDMDEFIARKKAERDEAYGIIEDATKEMQNSGEAFKTYLDVQAHFDRYSVSNAILIFAQEPEAVGPMKTFEDWKKDKVSIAKGEKAITMLEPGKEYEREDGSKGVNYNVKRVFDIIQTKDYQKSEHEISYDERTLLKSLITDAPCKMQISNEMAENINAIYKSDVKTIYVRQGMDAPSIFQALTKELAQAHMDKGAYYRHSDHYIAAYCVSYMLCKRYGVPTSSFDFKSMPEKYTSMDTKEFRQELGRIRDVAGVISRDMNRAMEAMQRATEKAVPEHTAPEPTR